MRMDVPYSAGHGNFSHRKQFSSAEILFLTKETIFPLPLFRFLRHKSTRHCCNADFSARNQFPATEPSILRPKTNFPVWKIRFCPQKPFFQRRKLNPNSEVRTWDDEPREHAADVRFSATPPKISLHKLIFTGCLTKIWNEGLTCRPNRLTGRVRSPIPEFGSKHFSPDGFSDFAKRLHSPHKTAQKTHQNFF